MESSSSTCPCSERRFTDRGLPGSLRSDALQDCRKAKLVKEKVEGHEPSLHPSLPAVLQSLLPAMSRSLVLPRDQDNVVLPVDGKEVRLTNLRKIFWPQLGLTKGDLIQYYADVAAVLLP